MRFHIVKFERLKKHPTEPFENMRVGVEILVEEDEDEDEAMAMAQQFVAKHLGEGLKVEEAEDMLQKLADAGVDDDALASVAASLKDQVVDKARRLKLLPSLLQKQTGPDQFDVLDHKYGPDHT